MTLNQVIERVRSIALNHKQVKNFYRGQVTEFLNAHTTEYASIFLLDRPGVIDLAGKVITYNFDLYGLDLVNVSEDTKTNEQDVQSDMVSVLKDLLAEMNFGVYQDWKISGSNQFTLLIESFNDMVGGAMVSVAVSVLYTPDVCEVPTLDETNYPRYTRVLMRDLAGDLVSSYPVMIYDINGEEVDFAENKTEYIIGWNGDGSNKVIGQLSPGKNDFTFVLTVNAGEESIPYVIADPISEFVFADSDGRPIQDPGSGLLSDLF